MTFLIPTHVFAQCAGEIDIENDGTDTNGNLIPDYLIGDLPEPVNWTLTPAAGGSLSIDVDTVRFALTCANNGDQVPCSGGNGSQAGDPTETPLVYTQVGAPGGTCNATLLSNTNGVVTFQLPEILLDGAGCTITFATELEDKGTDGDPLIITPAAAFNGTCQSGSVTLQGSAAGSASLEIIEPVCIPEIDVCVAVDTDNDGSFDDEECIPDNIGLTGNGTRDPKDFRYFVDVDKDETSDDLDGCVIEELIDDVWTPVANVGVIDGPDAGAHTQDGMCSADGDARTYRVVCDTCLGYDIDSDAGPVDASVECVDCAVQVDKTATCDDGTSFGESCTGWDDVAETSYRYVITNTGDVDLGSCVLTDDDAQANPNYGGPPIAPGANSGNIDIPFEICQDYEGMTDADVTCECLPTANGQDLEIGDNRVGINEDSAPDASFAPCSASDDDDAQILCESVSLTVTKLCEEQDEAGDSAVTVTIMNGGEADLESCSVVDTLDDGSDTVVPLDCVDELDNPIDETDFTIPGMTTYTCSGTVNGLLQDTDNDVVVSCLVEGTSKPKEESDSDLCEVPELGCLTRTPGFWGTHPHVTELFLPLEVCDLTIDHTDAGTNGSATEDMCWGGKDFKNNDTSPQQLQLYRQCMAAALNIEASLQGEGSCGTEVEELFNECCVLEDEESLCGNAPTAAEINESECIELLDEFNNSEDTLDPFGPFESPGPANSQECREANGNGYINYRDHGPKDGGAPANARPVGNSAE